MRRAERACSSFQSMLLRSYLHTSPRRRLAQPEPKSDKERAKLGLPLREPWFEVKPFDEKKKNFVLRLKEILQAQPKQKIEVASLGQLRQELDVVRQGKQRKIATYVRRFPSAYTLRSFYTPNNKKKTWCGFSADAQKLLIEEDLLFQASEALHVQKLRKLLMISMKNRLPFSSIKKVRESLGLPFDFKESLVNKHPDIFLLKERKGYLYLELKEWDDSLAISALEKQMQTGDADKNSKKSKKQRRERMAVDAEENGPGGLCGTDQEQRVYSKRDVELTEDEEEREQLCIAEDEGNAQKEEKFEEVVISRREMESSEQRAYSRGDLELTEDEEEREQLCLAEDEGNAQKEEFEEEVITRREMESRKVQSFLFKEEKGLKKEGKVHEEAAASYELPSLSTKEATINECQEDKVSSLGGVAVYGCHHEREFFQTPTILQANISSLLDLSDDEGTAISKVTHIGDGCSSAVTDEKHEGDNELVSKRYVQISVGVDVSADVGNVQHSTSGSETLMQSCNGTQQNSACLPFPWKNKRGKQPNMQHAAEIEAFQCAPYISPYRNSRDLELPAGSMAREKFIAAVLHEFLSLTLEKRATLQQLELFQRPYRLPGSLLNFLLKYDGIFYVVQGKSKSHVFLKEAYKESILLEKDPLVLWQERFVELAFSLEKTEKSRPSKESSPQQAVSE